MSHNSVALSLNNKPVITVSTTGASLTAAPFYTYGPQYGAIGVDDTIITYNNAIENLSIFPGNIGVTSMTFDNLEAMTGSYVNVNQPLDITLTNINFPVLKYLNSFNFTSIYKPNFNFPALQYLGNFNIANASSGSLGMTTLSFPELLYVGTFSVASNSATITSVNFNKLKKMFGNFNLSNTGCPTISFPALTQSNASLTLGSNYNLTSVSFPVLFIASSISIGSNLLTSISFPQLISINQFSLAAISPALTTISFPELIQIIGLPNSTPITISSGQATALTSISFPKLKNVSTHVSGITIQGCALTQTAVDNILIKFASLDGTNGTTLFSSKSIIINGGTSATPSATGLAAKATLVARGCTVTNN